jgi:uncharacterized membrane protein
VRPLRLASAAVAVVGLGIAGYLTAVHYGGGEPACAIAHGCATVQQSEYAELAGVPVALLGLVGYAGILLTLLRDDEAARAAAQRSACCYWPSCRPPACSRPSPSP